MNLVAVSLRSIAYANGIQMALTVLCDEFTSPPYQCLAFYVDGDGWPNFPSGPSTVPGGFVIVNAEPFFFLRWHWWDPINLVIFNWAYSWYGPTAQPNWYWGVYWSCRTYTLNYLPANTWFVWFWWAWFWIYWH